MLTATIIGAVMRHLLGAAGAAVAASGYLNAADAQLAIGALTTLGSLVWSIVQKVRSSKAAQ